LVWKALTLFALDLGVLCTEQRGLEQDHLSRVVPAFQANHESRLKALIRFARMNNLSFGIEFSTEDLDQPLNLEVTAIEVRTAIGVILGVSQPALSTDHGVVLIKRQGVESPAWLDNRIRRFWIPRVELPWASLNLSMALARHFNPVIAGFAGDFPPADPAESVGPMDVHGATVRDLLCRIVAASHSSWIVTRLGADVPSPAFINEYWTVMYPSGVPAAGASVSRPAHRVP
jgi:hypothetical protein